MWVQVPPPAPETMNPTHFKVGFSIFSKSSYYNSTAVSRLVHWVSRKAASTFKISLNKRLANCDCDIDTKINNDWIDFKF